ncbi:hypothetical protein [Cellulomonas sp.]|uniref:hypothetical protein n=1 Tax=Cellulomonas sp. TaxID=40001 RepID=UPI002D2DDD67|nr:hypothetical protein [Cellulomonas sp.]HYQ76180.1 hypothetical protein [Cellulomonas sp.]
MSLRWIRTSGYRSQGVTYDLGVALLAALPAFVVSVATHHGLLKPTGISAAAQSVGSGSRSGAEA